MQRTLIVASVATAGALATTLAIAATHGVKTTRPAQLVATEPGVVIDPILSTGDTVGGYQMSGIPDGLGAYRSGGDDDESDNGNDGSHEGDDGSSGSGESGDSGSITLLMNHELAGNAPPGPGARVSKLTIDASSRSVKAASYVVTGLEQYARFCSASLAILNGKAWYQTGEESTGVGTPSPTDTSVGRGGTSIAIDVAANTVYETPQFGYLAHENVVAAKRLPTATWFTTEDGSPTGNRSQLYAYISNDGNWEAAIKDTAAAHGSLYAWRADDAAADGNPSTNDIHRGQTLRGHFVPVTRAENSNAATLEAAAQAKGAFDFTRLEDLTATNDPSRFYFNDTGALGAETQKGRLYRLDVNRSNPREASVTLLVDGDLSVAAGDANDIVNPDNIAASSRSLIIQEDRNEENRSPAVKGGYSRILVYDIGAGTIRSVARVNTTVGQPGDWESSGVINASGLLGENWWFVDVQAHTQVAPQPGPTLTPNSSVGEDGQLLAIKIPRA